MVAQVRSSPIEDVKDENKKEERERSVWFFTFFFIQGTDDFRNRVKSFILIPRVIIRDVLKTICFIAVRVR